MFIVYIFIVCSKFCLKMPPKGKSEALRKKQSLIGRCSENKKALSDFELKIIEQEIFLSSMQVEISENSKTQQELGCQLIEVSKQVHSKQKKLRRKNNILNSLENRIVSLDNHVKSAKKKLEQNEMSVSVEVAKKRKLNPTTSCISDKAKNVRCNETFQAGMAIHGGTCDKKEPVLTGLLQTMTTKFGNKDVATHIMNTKSSVARHVTDLAVRNMSKDYYQSEDNILRSMNTYYCHNVMGKSKYLNIRKANKNATFRNQQVVNYIPYKNLSARIANVDIGTIHDINTLVTEDIEKVEGMYRPCDQYALRLARFYLHVNETRTDKLKSFPTFPKKDSTSTMFILSIGGDGAPLTGCCFLISFLNVGNRLTTSKENYLIFGGNVEESSHVVRRFVLRVLSDIRYLESQVFQINLNSKTYKVEFKLGELPNDMKMLAFLAGELSNAAHFFSTFADVNKDNMNDVEKSFIKEGWKPFPYEKRVNDAKKANLKKIELQKSKASETTKRSQFTSYISKTLKSRQEEVPLLEEYIDRAKAEPLHVKNNTVKELFIKLFKLAKSQSDLKGAKVYSQISDDVLFAKFVFCVHYKMGCNFLSKKIITWFNENNGKVEKDFTFRFRGKESRAYMKFFPELIMLLLSNIGAPALKLRLHQIFLLSLHHRNIISLSVRIEGFNYALLQELQEE